jgi:hypothetical protein
LKTVTIVSPDGNTEVSSDDPRIRAYEALQKAIGQIAKSQYRRGGWSDGPGKPAFVATGPDVRALVNASSDVLAGTITPEQAMAMIHEPAVFEQRFRKG